MLNHIKKINIKLSLVVYYPFIFIKMIISEIFIFLTLDELDYYPLNIN